MNEYLELKKQHQKESDEFPYIFAFSKEQLIEGMPKFWLKENEINKLIF